MEVLMNRLILSVVVLGLLSGCSPRKMSTEEIATQKKAIETLVSNFMKAYEAKDLTALTKVFTPSDDLMFFGTDSAEVIRTLAQWESQAKNDWELFQTVKFGDFKNVATVVSDDGTLGSLVCEVPADVVVGGQPSHNLFRFACVARKENGEWRMVQGMIAMATVGQSSAEMVAKMEAESAKPRGK
jgi:ketosteroid isomerase-like protein